MCFTEFVLIKAQALAAALWKLNIPEIERKKLQRMIDVTRASLFFAKSILAVEGPCEELVIPALASSKGMNLADKAITIIPLDGLPGPTMLSLFGEHCLRIPCAVLTDGDPETEVRDVTLHAELSNSDVWKTYPILADLQAEDQAQPVAGPTIVRTFKSSVTFEYDLALPTGNAHSLTDLWRSRMGGRCVELTLARMDAIESDSQKAVFYWQGSCLNSGGRYKAAFAHEIAEGLQSGSITLAIPGYVLDALAFLGLAPSVPTQ